MAGEYLVLNKVSQNFSEEEVKGEWWTWYKNTTRSVSKQPYHLQNVVKREIVQYFKYNLAAAGREREQLVQRRPPAVPAQTLSDKVNLM